MRPWCWKSAPFGVSQELPSTLCVHVGSYCSVNHSELGLEVLGMGPDNLHRFGINSLVSNNYDVLLAEMSYQLAMSTDRLEAVYTTSK